MSFPPFTVLAAVLKQEELFASTYIACSSDVCLSLSRSLKLNGTDKRDAERVIYYISDACW